MRLQGLPAGPGGKILFFTKPLERFALLGRTKCWYHPPLRAVGCRPQSKGRIGVSTRQLQLDIVQYQDGDCWMSHCVQFDLVTAAADKEESWRMAQAMCIAAICHESKVDPEFRAIFKPASAELSRMMAMARDEGSVVVAMNRHLGCTLHRLAAAA